MPVGFISGEGVYLVLVLLIYPFLFLALPLLPLSPFCRYPPFSRYPPTILLSPPFSGYPAFPPLPLSHFSLYPLFSVFEITRLRKNSSAGEFVCGRIRLRENLSGRTLRKNNVLGRGGVSPGNSSFPFLLSYSPIPSFFFSHSSMTRRFT